MAKLIYPRSQMDISVLTPNEPMRMTLSGEPVTAIKIGAERTVLAFLVFAKDGAITSLINGQIKAGSLRFIDYLTEGESVTIHGDAPERTAEQIAGSIPVLPEIGIGDSAQKVPDFIPFRCRFPGANNEVYEMMWVPTTTGRRISLSFWSNGRQSWGSPDMGGRPRIFMGYLEDPSIERWRCHAQRTNHSIVSLDQWPA